MIKYDMIWYILKYDNDIKYIIGREWFWSFEELREDIRINIY